MHGMALAPLGTQRRVRCVEGEAIMNGSETKSLEESEHAGWSAFDVWRRTVHEPRRQRHRSDDPSRRAAQVAEPIQLVAEALQKAHL